MIGILGAGAFGTALAVALTANGPVTLWGRRIGWQGENPRLPGVAMPDGQEESAETDDADLDPAEQETQVEQFREFLDTISPDDFAAGP